jgi:circadian clock protein KaiB
VKSKTATKNPNTRVARKQSRVWELLLYVNNATVRSVLATESLRRLCERYLHGQYRLTIIDIVENRI